MAAYVPVPSATTSFSIIITWDATRGDTSRRRYSDGLAPPATWSTRWGRDQTPRLATAAYAAAICTGVTAMPWPIGTLPIVEPDHLSGGSTIPGLSPGKSIPVTRPKPKRVIHFD